MMGALNQAILQTLANFSSHLPDSNSLSNFSTNFLLNVKLNAVLNSKSRSMLYVEKSLRTMKICSKGALSINF